MRGKNCFLCFVLCFCLLFEQTGFAQVSGIVDISGRITAFHNQLIPDKFRPLHLRSLGYDEVLNDFRLVLDKGDIKDPQTQALETTARTLLNYFFIGIALPNDAFWVNLRPDSEDNIIDPELAKTDIGRILLDADVQLKKDLARFTSPDTPEGKEYWEKVYRKAGELLGPDNFEIPTLTRPWIVPGEIVIREAGGSAYIYKATLRVMLEQDHLKGGSALAFEDPRLKALNEYSSQVIRARILPGLAREINVSARYAPLRQVYYSLVLAQWFKSRFRNTGGQFTRLIDSRRLEGLTSRVPWSKMDYFRAYRVSFTQGEYDIQRVVSTSQGRSTRRYSSGGMVFNIPMSVAPGAETAAGGTKVIDISGNAAIMPKSDNTLGFRVAGLNTADLSSVQVMRESRDGGALPDAGVADEIRRSAGAVLPFSEQDLPGFKRFVFRKGTAFGSYLNWSGSEPLNTPHLGIDISQYEREDGSVASIREGSPVHSITSGVVIRGIPGDEEIVVLTDDNMLIRYGHIVSRVDVGDTVSPGSVIGEFRFDERMQGRMATHLHLQVAVNADRNIPTVARALDLVSKGYPKDMLRVMSWNFGARAWSFLDSGKSETVDPVKLWPQLFQGSDFQPDETIEEDLDGQDGGALSDPDEVVKRISSELTFIFNYGIDATREKLDRYEAQLGRLTEEAVSQDLRWMFRQARITMEKVRKKNDIERKVRDAAAQKGRKYIERANYYRNINLGDTGPGLIGHATNYEALLKILLDSRGILKPMTAGYSYFDVSGGQAERGGINQLAGLVPLIFSRKGLEGAGVRFSVEGELMTSDEVPLKYLTAAAKRYVVETVVNIVDSGVQLDGFEGLTLDEKTRSAVASSLGYPTWDSLTDAIGLARDGGEQVEEMGGVDFRALPIVSQPVNAAMFHMNAADFKRLGAVDIDAEREKIGKMIRAGDIPSVRRLQEYVQACCIRKVLREQVGTILGYIADIMRLEEERMEGTSRELRDMLVLIDAGKPESLLLAHHP